MVLDDERCMEMYKHCRKTLESRAAEMKMVVPDGSAFPIIKRNSTLLLRPVFNVVNTFPIDEHTEIDCNDWDVHRPMYYCELLGRAVIDMKRRKAMRKRRRANNKKE